MLNPKKFFGVLLIGRDGVTRGVISIAWLLFCLTGCAARMQTDRNTPEQNFASSFNFLLGASKTQSAALEPIWMAYQQSAARLRDQHPAGSDELFFALEKLDQSTLETCRAHLTAKQSKKLEAIFKERLDDKRASAKRMREIEEELDERGPETAPPDSKGDQQSPRIGGGGGAGTW